MKRMIAIGLIGLGIGGCAVDPISDYLRNHNYKAITPVSDGHYVGGIYPKNDLSGAPLILLTDVLDKNKAIEYMNTVKGNSSLSTEAVNKTYDIGADVEIIGYLGATLKTNGIKKFSVRASGAKEYVLSQAKFKQLLDDKYKKLLEGSSVNGKYYVYSLLKVDSLEYEFFNENDTKIAVETLENLEGKIKAKIGPEWKVTKNASLMFDEPRFIGFRAKKIHTDASGNVVLKRAPINDDGPGGEEPRPHPEGPNCYRDCP
ncbi:hypothetical protein [Sulfuriflexus mobilis]|uniref:hypothetical protein n=1 Tax=Sulfuriflexus mobilis TaxID=1811807 RepID=UPI000F822507|nr:hypothetical protein [Sulfuriflexus mobilis]